MSDSWGNKDAAGGPDEWQASRRGSQSSMHSNKEYEASSSRRGSEPEPRNKRNEYDDGWFKNPNQGQYLNFRSSVWDEADPKTFDTPTITDRHTLWASSKGVEFFEPIEPGCIHMGWKPKGAKDQALPKWMTSKQLFEDKMQSRSERNLAGCAWANRFHLVGNLKGYMDTRKEDWDIASEKEGENKAISKEMTRILRWDAVKEGLPMDRGGWVPVIDLASKIWRGNKPTSQMELFTSAQKNDKSRFEMSAGLHFIRAVQGHGDALWFIEDAQYFEKKLNEDDWKGKFIVHATSKDSLHKIMNSSLQAKNHRQFVHFAKDWSNRNRKAGRHINSAIYIGVGDLQRAGHDVWASQNGVLCVKGPISPSLFKRAGTIGDKGWEWNMVDGRTRTHTERSAMAENTISVELRNEENKRVRQRNLEKLKKDEEMRIEIEELEKWTLDKRIAAESTAEQRDLESGARRNLLLESTQAKPKVSYRKDTDDPMSPSYLEETDISELERKQAELQEEQAKTENEKMIEEVNTKIPMKRDREDLTRPGEAKKPDTYNRDRTN